MKRKWYVTGLSLFLAFILGFSTPVYASDIDQDVFDEWTDEKRDDALMVLEATEWEAFEDQLIIDQKIKSGMQTREISNKVKKLEKTVKNTLKSSNIPNAKKYTPLILAMIQVMNNGNPSETDPCCINQYISKSAIISSPEASVLYLLTWIQHIESAYNSSHKKKVNIEKGGDDMDIVIEAVMLREGYAREYTKYTLDNATKYYEDNKAVFDAVGITPILDFNKKVKKHIIYVNSTEGTTIVWNGNVTSSMQKVCDAARNGRSTRPATLGKCAAWVSGVYQYALGYYPGYDAIDYWRKWSSTGSRDSGNIPPGAAVVGTGSGTKYGHVGIYVGNGEVAENIGGYRVISLERWITSQNRRKSGISGEQGWVGWVWPDRKDLSKWP